MEWGEKRQKRNVANYHYRIQTINQYLIWVTNSLRWQGEDAQSRWWSYLITSLQCCTAVFKALKHPWMWKSMKMCPLWNYFAQPYKFSGEKIYKSGQINSSGYCGWSCSCHHCSDSLLYAAADYINWLPVATLMQQCRVFNDIFIYLFILLTAAYLWHCQLMWTWVLCVWSELFQLDRISNSKLSEYKYPCKYCSISVLQTVPSHLSTSCCPPWAKTSFICSGFKFQLHHPHLEHINPRQQLPVSEWRGNVSEKHLCCCCNSKCS